MRSIMPAAFPFALPKSLPIGLHLDGESVTVAQVALQGGRPVIQAVAAGELPADPNDLAGAAAALKRLLADHQITSRSVVSSLPPRELTVQNVRLPQVPDEELPPLVKWEAQERLAYPVDEAELRHLTAGAVREEGVTKQEVILLAARREAIERHVALLEAAGLTPSAIDLAACGMLRCLSAVGSPQAADPSRRAYVCLGATAVSVLVAVGGKIVFLRTLATGGRQLDQTLARATGLPEAEAAAMRRTVVRAAALDPADDLHRTVIDALRTSLESLAIDLELCLRHVQVSFRGAPTKTLSLSGPDATPWLAEFLADRLRTEVKVAHPFETFGGGISVPDQPGRFTIAVGLALRDLAPRPAPVAVPA
jgi:type IV pilus assembly protein PilM